MLFLKFEAVQSYATFSKSLLAFISYNGSFTNAANVYHYLVSSLKNSDRSKFHGTVRRIIILNNVSLT